MSSMNPPGKKLSTRMQMHHRRPRLARPLALGLGLFFALVAAPPRDARAQGCPAGALFPGAEWPDRTAEVAAARPAEVRALDELAFTLTAENDLARMGERTDALLVIHQGAIFYERYARGWTREHPHFGWSMSKSVTNALTGIAVREGALTLDSTVCDVLRVTLPTERHCRVTVRALLEFSSGFL